jgi:glycosyltransferase involved in cell wall biosynthesis
MRIAHVSDCFFPRLGGIERQVHDLAQHQRAQGHEVEIITAVAGGPVDALTAVDDAIVVHRPPSSRGKPAGTIQYASWLTGGPVVRAGNYDVVHVHSSTWSPMAGMTMRAAARAGIPVVVTVHSLWNRYWPLFSAANRVFGWNRLPVVWTAVSSVATVPLATTLRTGGQGGRRDAVEVLPNAVEHGDWSVEPRPRADDRVVIASVMRLALRKRPRHYLQMLRRARRLVPAEIALEAVIVGDGPRRAGLERYLARHNMTDWVTLYGRASHEQIREIYRDADFFVAPATLESFGIAALEARSAGLPIIAHRGSGVRDFIEHEREGLLADGDTDMAEQIARLAMTPQLRRTMTAYNRAHVPQFGWSDILAQCQHLYERAGYHPKSEADRADLAERSA